MDANEWTGIHVQVVEILGSHMSGEIVAMRSQIMKPLHWIGALLVGDHSCSRALSMIPKAVVHREADASVSWSFEAPAGLFSTVTRLMVNLNGQFHPRWFLVDSGKKHVAWKAVLHDNPKTATNPSLVDATLMMRAKGQTKFAEVGKLEITAVTPLTNCPKLFSPTYGTAYEDQATGFEVTPGSRFLLDESIAEKVMAAALSGQQMSSRAESNTPDCGVEALYYLARLHGAQLSFSESLSHFPDAQSGTSLGRLADACKEMGLKPRIGLSHDREIEALQLPAIVAVAPSHFCVAVRRDGEAIELIDPPYRVVRFPIEQFRSNWSGYALWIER